MATTEQKKKLGAALLAGVAAVYYLCSQDKSLPTNFLGRATGKVNFDNPNYYVFLKNFRQVHYGLARALAEADALGTRAEFIEQMQTLSTFVGREAELFEKLETEQLPSLSTFLKRVGELTGPQITCEFSENDYFQLRGYNAPYFDFPVEKNVEQMARNYFLVKFSEAHAWLENLRLWLHEKGHHDLSIVLTATPALIQESIHMRIDKNGSWHLSQPLTIADDIQLDSEPTSSKALLRRYYFKLADFVQSNGIWFDIEVIGRKNETQKQAVQDFFVEHIKSEWLVRKTDVSTDNYHLTPIQRNIGGIADLEFFKRLHAKAMEVNPELATDSGMLTYVIATRHHQALQYLLEELKLDPDQAVHFGRTPLAWAVVLDNVEAFDMLIQNGTEPHIMINEKDALSVIIDKRHPISEAMLNRLFNIHFSEITLLDDDLQTEIGKLKTDIQAYLKSNECQPLSWGEYAMLYRPFSFFASKPPLLGRLNELTQRVHKFHLQPISFMQETSLNPYQIDSANLFAARPLPSCDAKDPALLPTPGAQDFVSTSSVESQLMSGGRVAALILMLALLAKRMFGTNYKAPSNELGSHEVSKSNNNEKQLNDERPKELSSTNHISIG